MSANIAASSFGSFPVADMSSRVDDCIPAPRLRMFRSAFVQFLWGVPFPFLRQSWLDLHCLHFPVIPWGSLLSLLKASRGSSFLQTEHCLVISFFLSKSLYLKRFNESGRELFDSGSRTVDVTSQCPLR